MDKTLKDHPGKEDRGSLQGRKSKFLFIIIFTLLHMLVTVLLFFWSFSVVMGNADDGEPLPIAGEILLQVSEVFQWPVFIPLGRIEFLGDILPAYSGIFILLLNSLVWALVALIIVLGIQRILRRKRKDTI